VLAISGSAGADPLNRRLLESAARVAAPGADFELGPELDAIPFFHPDAEPTDAVSDLRARVAGADAVLMATPEHNGSIPASLKNAIDWVAVPERAGPIRGKPVAVIGADLSAIGCDWAHADVRKVLEVAGARVISAGLSLDSAADAFAEGERLRDEGSDAQLRTVVGELISEGSAPG
jgi:NAD(P)H-dependent FMN reductase